MKTHQQNIIGNNPTKEEVFFLESYLSNKLMCFEAADFTNADKQALFNFVSEARSIENALSDFLTPDGGNYNQLVDYLNTNLNLKARLANFLKESCTSINPKELDYLRQRSLSDNLIQDPKYGYNFFDLDEYLVSLKSISSNGNVDISSYSKGNLYHLEEVSNNLLDYLEYLIGLTHSVESQGTSSRPFIFLLRDTLLLYLGAIHIQSAGIPIEAKAAMINRDLLNSFATAPTNNKIYPRLYNEIYKCLNNYNGNYSIEFTEFYKQSVLKSKSRQEDDVLKFIRNYIFRLCGNQHGFIAVDCAAHGTMPLLTITGSDNVSEFRMFTSVPWLQEFYGEVIYRKNFPHMRMLESLVCQEELFRFSKISGDRIIIKETCDPVIQEHSKFEISYFLNKVDQRFLK